MEIHYYIYQETMASHWNSLFLALLCLETCICVPGRVKSQVTQLVFEEKLKIFIFLHEDFANSTILQMLQFHLYRERGKKCKIVFIFGSYS